MCALYFASGLTDVAIETGDENAHRRRTTMVERARNDLDLRHRCRRRPVDGRGGRRALRVAAGTLVHRDLRRGRGRAVARADAATRRRRRARPTALEQVLHNALLAGMSLEGDEWFYANPHATTCRGEEHPWIGEELPAQVAGPLPLRRAPWRDVTCCPPNVNRALATLPGQLYGTDADGNLWVHLFASSHVRAGEFELERRYRHAVVGSCDDHRARRAATRGVAVRARTGLVDRAVRGPVSTKSAAFGAPATSSSWISESRTDLLAANPRVESTRGSVAVWRGPFVYCFEGIDNPGVDDLRDLTVARRHDIRDGARSGRARRGHHAAMCRHRRRADPPVPPRRLRRRHRPARRPPPRSRTTRGPTEAQPHDDLGQPRPRAIDERDPVGTRRPAESSSELSRAAARYRHDGVGIDTPPRP